MTHTHGQWAMQFPADGLAVRHVRIDSDNGSIAIAEWQGSTHSTNSIALLIAAAPELLAALIHLVSCTDETYDNRHEMRAAIDAINRALGCDE